jgi:hypothetical protein
MSPWGRAILLIWLAGLPAAAPGQSPALPGPIPLAVDFKKAPLGSWATYTIKTHDPAAETLQTRWAFLGRDAAGNTLELTVRGSSPALTRLGGQVVTRLVLVPDPVGVSRPFRQMVMQLGDRDPIEVPLDLPGLPGHKFQNPDPKKRLGRETIRVAGGTWVTSHYREIWEESTVDAWVSDQVPPLGLVKTTVTPTPGTLGPGGRPMPAVTMELVAHGKDARPAITRPPQPFVPARPGPP